MPQHPLQDVFDQGRQLRGFFLHPLPKRRHNDLIGTEPVIEVIPKLSFPPQFIQRAVGGGKPGRTALTPAAIPATGAMLRSGSVPKISCGIWDNPLVSRYHEQIQQGRGVIEALRSGVEMNQLDHFMNIDSIGVLRKQPLGKDERIKVILQALRQVGKPYDFNFDVESKGKVYCSKLVYLAYSGVEWSTKRSLGRTTFTPDDVANRALAGNFRLVLFYHDGKQVNGRHWNGWQASLYTRQHVKTM